MSDLAQRLQHLPPDAKRAVLAKLVSLRNRSRTAPLSHAQRRLWFLEQLVPGSPSYNESSALRLLVPLDAPALERSLDEIVRRHEALRTVFEAAPDEPVQRVLRTLRIGLPVIDLQALAADQREAEALRRVREQAAEPFDLAKGPLLRAALLRLGPCDHMLALTMHHIVCDGWSMRIFFDELWRLYQAFAQGRPSPLPDLPIQYTDFTLWQHAWLSGPRMEEQLAFWKERLAGLPVLDLPTDRPRPKLPSFRGGCRRIMVPPPVAGRLRHLCEREGVTPFMALLTAFHVLLHRYCGQDDVAVGCPVAGRSRPELEQLIGFFVNTLVMRADLGGNPSFREALRRARDMALPAYAHQDLPFERLVEELQPERNPGRNPLFQVTFQMLSEGAAPAAGPLQPVDAGTVTAKFDLQCDLWPRGEGFEGQLVYAADLFDPETADALARHLETVISAMAQSPDMRVADAPLLSPQEERRILVEWNDTAVAFPAQGPVHERFDRMAAAHPERLAVAEGTSSITYGGLKRRADRLARLLAGRGIGCCDRVALVLDRSIDLVACALASLKAGAAYLPLDPAYPGKRLELVLREAGAALVLVSSRHRDKVPDGFPILPVPKDGDGQDAADQADPTGGADGEDIAYVIFTSGSTGTPRGVEIRHAGLANLVDWHQREYAVTAEDRAMLYASPGFDASVWEMWPYLAAGASLHVPDAALRASPGDLAQWMAENAITIGFLPTPVAESFVEGELPPPLRLRVLLTGGDRLRRPPARPLPFRFVNHYGPTENTVVATAGEVVPDPSGREPGIGRPIANVRAYVLDRAGRPVPAGAKGELHLGGLQLARGYLGAPGPTRARFVPDPFGRDPAARLYRTGDLVRHRRDGTLEFHGRLDGQLKIRGHRIEPGDVEAVLDRHPAVLKSLVAVLQDPSGDPMLAAYVTPRPPGGGPAATRSLRRHAREHLPRPMVPSAFVWTDALPLTAHGKLDRRAAEGMGPIQEEEDIEASGCPIEAQVAAIWKEALGLRQVGVHDNFFDAGGHSLLLVRVHGALRRTFDTSLSVVDLFRLPTINDLARAIAAEREPK
jgi:amino acid adenylation domain-containing protein